MAIFGKRRREESDWAGVAIVTKSSSVANKVRGSHPNVEERENEFNAIGLGTIPHDLTLEVRIPGREPFEITKRVKVPARATGRQGYDLPLGVELPVTPRGDDDVEIDWKQFLKSPGRKTAVQKAAADESYARVKEYTEAIPGRTEQTWASAAAGMPNWMEAVRQGKMKRKAFDQQVDTLTRIGQMDPELAAEGKATLDAEGF
jgi:hypothetical protein